MQTTFTIGQYDYFYTSDGRLWAARRKVELPAWTPDQERNAVRSYFIGRLIVIILSTLEGIYIWRILS